MPDQYEQIKLQTRSKIQQAFIALMADKPYREITVREIADHAGIGFRTFYHHYQDKDALANALVDQAVQALTDVIEPVATLTDIEANVRRVVQLIAENVSAFNALSRLPEREKRLTPIVEKGANDLLAMKTNSTLNEPTKNMLGRHFASTQLELMIWWVANDMPIPAEQMVNYMMKLIVRPIWEFSPD